MPLPLRNCAQAERKATGCGIFPQLVSLGKSDRAKFFGLSGLNEASAFLAEPNLGPRLTEISRVLLVHEGRDPVGIFGVVDGLKLRSSMTLFAAVPGTDPVFDEVLCQYFGATKCEKTLAALA